MTTRQNLPLASVPVSFLPQSRVGRLIGVMVLAALLFLSISTFNRPAVDKSSFEVTLTGETFEQLVLTDNNFFDQLFGRGYKFVSPGLTEANFPIKATPRVVHIELIPLSVENQNGEQKTPSVEKAIALLDRRGYRPADAEEFLALAKANPTLGVDATIVAAGTIWATEGHTAVASLWGYKFLYWNMRHLDVFGAGVVGFRTPVASRVLFAAVPK